ncbi:MAG: TldD/PmbA family protein [Solobacterium sp.]|nr:TldD/PmbA family protein [Solobacterium sp.]
MLEKIIELLKKADTDGWTVTDTVTEGWEFYFIRHDLDQNRVRNTEHIIVNVYKKFQDGKYLGNASGEIAPTASEKEAEKIINDLISRAVLVKNPVYTLNPKAVSECGGEIPDVKMIAKDFIEAMQEVRETETEDINSYEIFVNSCRRRFLSSEGTDVTFVYPSSMIEAVVNARKDGHEIELYRMYRSGTCAKEDLVNDLQATLKAGCDRLEAKNTPSLNTMPVVFSSDAALKIYEYFIDRMNAGYKYQGISNWEIGKPVAEDMQGDRVTVDIVRQLANSSMNFDFDGEGAPVRECTLIRDGIAQNFYGNRQFSQYLGLKESSNAYNFVVTGGSKTEEELRSGSYLELVEFSDFQVSPFNGDIAGEIRLGYYHDGGKVTVISGGSVSGSMRDYAKNMHMSLQQRQYNNFVIPAFTRLENVRITGAE